MPAPLSRLGIQCTFIFIFSIFERLLRKFKEILTKRLDKKKELWYSSFEIKIRKWEYIFEQI